jgi:hypothetical protein
MDDAGVIDQNVEMAERRDGLLDEVRDCAALADVGRDEPAVSAERIGFGFASGSVNVGDDDPGALGDIAPRDREADAVRAAGNDRNPVRKSRSLCWSCIARRRRA